MTSKSRRTESISHNHTSHIEFRAVGQGPDGERFIRVEIRAGKKMQTVLFRYDDFADGSSEAFSNLNRNGAHLVSRPAKTEFLKRLQDLGPKDPSFSVATRVGPFGTRFVLPHSIVGVDEQELETQFDRSLDDYIAWGRQGGTVKGWQKLGDLVRGNSRLILALGIAFSGPLRLIAPVEPIAFQLSGVGGTGKSSIGVVASSIWGQRLLGGKPHDLGGGDAWNNTVNNLERVLAGRDHTFLFLDEAHLAKPNDVVDAMFMISEGQGKGRYTEVRRWQWFVPILSTSNDSVAEILQKAREPLERAAFDRLVDIPLPDCKFGAFENLHGSADAAEFSVRLKAISDIHFGVVGRRFVRKILEELAYEGNDLPAWVESRRAYFETIARKRVSAEPRHNRVTGRFATVYAALRLAFKYGLISVSKEETRDALLACLRDHLTATDGVAAKQASLTPLARLEAHIRKNRANFVDLGKPSLPKGHVHKSCPGYIQQRAGRTWILFSNSMLESIVGDRSQAASLCREFEDKIAIRTTGGGKDGNRYATKVKIGSRREYVIAIDASQFA